MHPPDFEDILDHIFYSIIEITKYLKFWMIRSILINLDFELLINIMIYM